MYIPKKIKVGYQNRQDTYTKKLAYVIYYDNKDKLHKETSWQGWRDKDIEPDDFNNIPMSGFVLNKKVGDYHYGWDSRKSYIRVFDPRGFEFEISVDNLIYILEHCNSEAGKGLDGEFIYGWDGKDLVLLPVNSPDYSNYLKMTELKETKSTITNTKLKIGATYKSKNNNDLVYLCKGDNYNYFYYYDVDIIKKQDNCKKQIIVNNGYWFYDLNANTCHFIKSINGKFAYCIDENCHIEFESFYEKLLHDEYYSPIDLDKTQFEEVKELELNGYERSIFYVLIDDEYIKVDFGYSDNFSFNRTENIKLLEYLKNNGVKMENNTYKDYYKNINYISTTIKFKDLIDKIPVYKTTYYLESGYKYGER